MKKATTCNAFINILNTIHEEGITTKEALMTDQLLYAKLWYALTKFCRFALLSKTSGKNAEGEILPGNSRKIDVLESRGVATREELEIDCVMKIISKLDLVLRQPIEKQKNYCYVICNNMLNDCFRRLPPADIKFVSLNSTIEGINVAVENAYTYEDVIPDSTYDPDRVFFEKETIKELTKKLKTKQIQELAEKKAKQAQELARKKESILREISKLSTRAPEVFAHLGKHLGIKTRTLAARIIDNGFEECFAQIIIDVAIKYDIPLESIRNIISVNKLTKESFEKDRGLIRLLSQNPKVVADQISKYANRAKERVKEHPGK